jgi:hypothetical protein
MHLPKLLHTAGIMALTGTFVGTFTPDADSSNHSVTNASGKAEDLADLTGRRQKLTDRLSALKRGVVYAKHGREVDSQLQPLP